jgi:hypothetical protein
MFFFSICHKSVQVPEFGSFRPVINYPLGSGSIIEDYGSEDYVSKDPDPKEICTGMDPQHCLVRIWIQQQNRQKKIAFLFHFLLSAFNFYRSTFALVMLALAGKCYCSF